MDHRSWQHALIFAFTTIAVAVAEPGARAQSDPAATFPNRTVRIVVPNAPGGGTEIVARIIAQKLGEAWGQAVIVENRPGGNAIIGTDAVAKSKPDGYTILLTFPSHVTNPLLYSKLPYDSERDFAPVTMVDEFPYPLIVHPSVPAKTVKELIALAKAHPGQLSYATTGIGSNPHLGILLFMNAAGIKMVHVPYKGAGPGTVALVSGEVQVTFSSLLSALPMIKAGKLRLLALTSSSRLPSLPEVPTVAETLPSFEAISWHAMFVPAGTPRTIITKINAESVRALQQPDVKNKLSGEGLTLVGNTPEQFGAFLATDTRKWAKVIKDEGLHLEEDRFTTRDRPTHLES